MLFGAHACSFASSLTTQQDFPQAYTETCEDPHAVLIAMDLPPHLQNIALAAKFLAQFQATCLPPPALITLRQPVHLCAWRLDAPPRICLYTGEHPSDPTSIDPSTLLPHTLSKVLLEERTKRPNPARIHLTSHDEISPNAARLSLLHYAQTALTTQREKLPSQPTSTVLHHTLEEAITCLIHPPTRNHTTIELNQSPPWDKDHIDSRYPQETSCPQEKNSLIVALIACFPYTLGNYFMSMSLPHLASQRLWPSWRRLKIVETSMRQSSSNPRGRSSARHQKMA